MKHLLIAAAYFAMVGPLVLASELDMVFLVEDNSGKHIGLKTGSRGVKLLSEGKQWHLYPTLSSDGTKLAYAKGSGQTDLALVVRDLKSKNEISLSNPGFILHPRFAKNGSQLFFSEKVDGVNKIGFYDLENLEAGKKPKATYIKEEKNSFFPAPFQSGETVVYQRNAERKEIVLFDILADKKEVIGFGMSPSLSKNEKFIAFTSKVDGNWDVYIYDRFEKTTVRATKNASFDFSPSFDKDNNLLYTSDRLENGVFSIFRQSKDSWTKGALNEEVIVSKKGTSYYAPRVAGLKKYKVTLNPVMPGEPRSSFGAITHQGITYIVGGHQGAEHTYPPESFTGRVTAFDNSSKSWTNKAPRLNPSHGFQLAADGDAIFAFGGFAYEETNYPKWKSIDVVEKYDIKSNSWEEIGKMPRRRSSNVVVRVEDKVYVIGGWDATPKTHGDIDGTFHEEIDVYDIKKNSWTTLDAKLPKKRRAFSAFARQGKIYLVGGISEGGSHFSLLDDFTEFDPKTGSFKEFPKLPFPTFAPASGYKDNHAFMFGGMFKTGAWEYEYVPHIYQFDFSGDQWRHTGRFLNEYKGFSQVANLDKCLGVLGGHSYQNNQDKPVDSFEVFCL